MSPESPPGAALAPPMHSRAFRVRRFLNWFPMGLTYALLYMGRYNLTVSKNSLGVLMTKEDFGTIFGVGTLVYGIAFLINGPLTDRLGGRRALLFAALGAAGANFAMGLFIFNMLAAEDPGAVDLRLWMSVLYAVNMYFQSFGAVAIVKVNAHWFHVRERGGFSGIFGTMISSGIFLAFTVNGWILDIATTEAGLEQTWWVFYLPAALLFVFFLIELALLKDRPGQAGFADFDTGDASSGEGDERIPALVILKRILSNPIILTVALIEFCTGVLRNGVMHWFPIYAKEVWALPSSHFLRNGSWESLGGTWAVLAIFAAAAGLFVAGYHARGKRRALAIISGAVVALSPFFFGAGWGGMLFVAGVVGGNVAGWSSDLLFQSRRGPSAAFFYLLIAVCIGGMCFTLGGTTNEVAWVGDQGPFERGDRILAIAGEEAIEDWSDVAQAVAAVPARCLGGAVWDVERCMCSTAPKATDPAREPPADGMIRAVVERAGSTREIEFSDPKPEMKAGDRRVLAMGPVLTLWPFFLGLLVFLISIGVIGTHGLLSGTATMDFGGRRAAATAVGIIDGFVYLGTGLQSFCLGYLTTEHGWSWWPLFLLPFALIGFLLCLRIWHAMPGAVRRKR